MLKIGAALVYLSLSRSPSHSATWQVGVCEEGALHSADSAVPNAVLHLFKQDSPIHCNISVGVDP